MFVAREKILIRLAGADSLKDKRAVVRSLKARLKQRFNLSVAEVDRQDDCRTIVLGIACVGSRAALAEEVLDAAGRYVQSAVEEDVLFLEREVD